MICSTGFVAMPCESHAPSASTMIGASAAEGWMQGVNMFQTLMSSDVTSSSCVESLCFGLGHGLKLD